MPKLHRWAKCALSVAGLLVGASPAHAALENIYLDKYVTVDPLYAGISVDYSVISDGIPRRWDFEIQSDDPTATLKLYKPNEVFAVYKEVGPGGAIMNAFGPDPAYVFTEIYKGPGLVSYYVWADRSFNTCDTPGPVGSICAATNIVWGNNAGFVLDADAPMTIHFTSTVIPEPATWSLMILGFGGAGAMLRRRRRLAA